MKLAREVEGKSNEVAAEDLPPGLHTNVQLKCHARLAVMRCCRR